MEQRLNAIIFAEQQKKADELYREIKKVSHGLHLLGACSSPQNLQKELINEKGAIIFVDIDEGCKNLPEYFLSLNLRKRKFVCIIPESGEFASELNRSKIHYIQRPITNLKLQVEMRHHTKGSPFVDLALVIIKEEEGKVISEPLAIIPLGTSIVLKVKEGRKHFDINRIMRFQAIKTTRHVNMFLDNGDVIEVSEMIGLLIKRLKKFDFECSNRSELLNLLYVDFIDKRTTAILGNDRYPIHANQVESFNNAWNLFWDGRGNSVNSE